MRGYISRLPLVADSPAFPRRLCVLGATGSIGASTLDIAGAHPDMFSVLALAGANNVRKLAELAARFRPKYLAVLHEDGVKELLALLPPGYRPFIAAGESAYVDLATLPEADVVVSAIVGAAGLAPTLAAARAGKTIALANKESLVLAGDLIRGACAATGAVVLPVDSEHNALFQALRGHDPAYVSELILTASGGPFRDKDAAFIASVTPEQALAHPNWSMGAKISIDSATLMNKGLEVIEACHLYGLAAGKVAVVVHPQSIVHSLVRYADGSLLAHLGPPDMRVAISYCLGYPLRLPLNLAPLDIVALGKLTFEAPREDDFPCLGLARRAFEAGGGATVVLNAANEAAVELFLARKIGFTGIARIVETALDRHAATDAGDLDSILALDRETRDRVKMTQAGLG
ncbi:MAG: 1-deoxy-D-xylulose-5-phosphate reductoisomerase [Desulfovibrionaceae bacterium]|nr:1-deoxy-D-xylulose-5-phosphate reductoisomerase [Desulfovibrionaceae bacterium]MBF0512951.1 1-deoxy-D-xylulose-5-phosphate reductoisomerase [Desulfovibrionaceae bacterium]